MIATTNSVVDRKEFEELKHDAAPILKLLSIDENDAKINETYDYFVGEGKFKQVPTRYQYHSMDIILRIKDAYGLPSQVSWYSIRSVPRADYAFKLADKWLLRCKDWLNCSPMYTQTQLLYCLTNVIQVHNLSVLIVSYMDFVEPRNVWIAGKLLFQFAIRWQTTFYPQSHILYETFESKYATEIVEFHKAFTSKPMQLENSEKEIPFTPINKDFNPRTRFILNHKSVFE